MRVPRTLVATAIGVATLALSGGVASASHEHWLVTPGNDHVVVAAGLDNGGPFDLIQAFVSSQGELEAQLAGLKARRKPKGLLWITYPKGAAKIKSDIHRDTIWRYAQTIGLAGVALVTVDDTWSAMRLK